MIRRATLALGLAGLTVTMAMAHQGVTTPEVRERMDSMKSMNEAFKAVGLMVRGQAEFDKDVVDAAVERLRLEAHRTPELFEARAEDPLDEATSDLWENWDHFLRLTSDMAEALAAPAPESLDEAGAWMARVGATCSACHEDYRE